MTFAYALVLSLAVLAPASIAEPAKVAGVWSFSVELAVGTGHPTVTLKQEGEKITGTYDGRYGPAPLEGTVKDRKIEFTVSMTAEGTAVFGPVVTPAPQGEAAGKLWDGVRLVAGTEGFFEIKRSRTVGPIFD